MNQDRNEDIWPNGKLPNVYHMEELWKEEEMVLKMTIVLIQSQSGDNDTNINSRQSIRG